MFSCGLNIEGNVVARAKILGKSILLLILIVILVLFGLLWFDYLGIIQAKKTFAPVYKLLRLQTQTNVAPSSPSDLAEVDKDNDRFAKRIESLDEQAEELNKREADIENAENNNAQVAQELEDQKKALEEREKTFNNELKKYDDRKVNIDQIVSNLEGMQPANAVKILEAEKDDQLVIDILRREKEKGGEKSMAAYWQSLMSPERAAQINRKMASKPTSLE